jgi:Co/Zn/Cd efflux system component
MALALLLLVPGIATAWTAWQKLSAPFPPEPLLLSVTGLGALAVNVSCALLLVRFRNHSGSLTRAAFLSARNDALANVAVIAAAMLTLAWPSGWPDLIVGVGIAIMNADAAKKVWAAARKEQQAQA